MCKLTDQNFDAFQLSFVEKLCVDFALKNFQQQISSSYRQIPNINVQLFICQS